MKKFSPYAKQYDAYEVKDFLIRFKLREKIKYLLTYVNIKYSYEKAV